MHDKYIDQIKKFEGFEPKAKWDYKQWTNGYGTLATGKGEHINEAEADKRLRAELAEMEHAVEIEFGELPAGTAAALTSLSFNVGTKWMLNSGLANAVRHGTDDAIRERFRQYNKAGGKVMPGLVRRRQAEAQWIGQA